MTTKTKAKINQRGIQITQAEARLQAAANTARIEADAAKERQLKLERACEVIEGVRMLAFASEESRDTAIESLVQEVLGE